MTIYGNSKQNGTPTPENPKEIKNEAFIYCNDKKGNKVKVPLEYIVRKEYELKEGDQIKKIGDEWYLCRRSK